MGGGYWRREDFNRYNTGRGRKVRADGNIDTSGMRGAQDMYLARKLAPDLNPYKVIRECCDNEEHPQTIPVILALDVTGSMGGALLKTAASLNAIMQTVLDNYKDVEFMVMGIGDLAYDAAPIQISQFESDIRSYTAAWYMGLNHTALDCWKRGKKGIIITLGDEPLTPYLPGKRLAELTGDPLQGDVHTPDLYKAVTDKFEVYHIAIDDPGDCYRMYAKTIHKSFGTLLKDHLRVATLDRLPETIISCLETHAAGDPAGTPAPKGGGLLGLLGLGTASW